MNHKNKSIIFICLRLIFAPLRLLLDLTLQFFKTAVVFRIGQAIGEHVCLTALLRQLHSQYGIRSIIVSNYPELFWHNPDVIKVFDVKRYGYYAPRLARWLLQLLSGKYVLHFRGESTASEDLARLDEGSACAHLAKFHSHNWKFEFDYSKLQPRIEFSQAELAEYEARFDLPANFVIIQSEAKASYTVNKNWSVDKFQELVSATTELSWVQIGLLNEAGLSNVLDLRGRTSSLRELAYLISRAIAVVCSEGLLNHLAAGFKVPSIVIFSGFTPVELAKYATTYPVVAPIPIACAPCWLLTPCPVPGKPCTSTITAQQVTKILLPLLNLPKTTVR